MTASDSNHAASETARAVGQSDIDVTIAEANEATPEVDISKDIAKRGLMLAPALILVMGLIWKMDGVYSSAVAVGLVIFNFLWTAAMMAMAARISVGALMGSVLFGYLLRLGLIMVVFLLVRDESWFSAPAFGVSIIVTHLGLLIWETRHVSLTLAYPGLKPTRNSSHS